MPGFPSPIPEASRPYYALQGPWLTDCVVWDRIGEEGSALGYVTMGAWNLHGDDPFAQVTTLLDPRQITNSGPITRRHLVGWACLGLARADVPDIDRLVAKGVALSSPWEVVQVHDRSTSRAFLRCERSQRVVLASVDPVFPVVISHVGAVPLPLRLIDARPDSLAREPSDDP